MKTIRRSPITRATAWLVTLAMVAPCLMGGRVARAQTQQPLRVIIADIVNKSKPNYPNLGITATAAIYNEMVNSGQGRFSVLQNSEVLKEADSLQIKHPSNPNQPANFSQNDLLRIAQNLNVDAIVEGEVTAGAARGKGVQVVLLTNLRETASQQLINGGDSSITTVPRPGEPTDAEELTNKSVSDAAQDVVRQVLSRQLASATVIGIETDSVILNKGVRDGVKVGDDVVILREGANGQKTKVGTVKISRVYPTDSEAKILTNPGGIRPEDGARVLYQPRFILGPTPNVIKPTAKGAQFTLTALGSTLAVIGLGVLVSQASRGGQTSTTTITAEAGVASSAPVVRVRWQDNIFGQGNVQQYKIYREPDFPFGQSAGTGGGGGGGGGTVGGSVPVGVVTGVHEFFDHGSPFFPYASGIAPLVGSGNGNPVGGGGGSQNGGNQTGGCGSRTVAATLDTGFKPGSSYHYLVTAIILRQTPTSSGSNGTGGGGNGTGGGGNGTGGGGNGTGGGGNGTGGGGGGGTNGGGFECIESDPGRSGQSTPINPVLLTSPANNTASVNVNRFAPQFTSRNGADVFQIEVSTDRTFSNPSLIYRTQLISSAPNADGVAQTVTDPIDLSVQPELLRDPAFTAFAGNAGCSTVGNSAAAPKLYWRVGARHDGDQPGPIDAITQNASDPDKNFRFVYSQIFAFLPAPLPPCPPGGSRAAQALNREYTLHRAQLKALTPSNKSAAAGLHPAIQTPQQILLGNRKRN